MMSLTNFRSAVRLLASSENRPYPLLLVIALEQMAFVAFIVILVQEYVPEDLGLGVAFAGYIQTALGTTKLVSQAPLGWLADRTGYKPMLFLGLAASALAVAPLLVFEHRAALLLVAALYGVSRAVVTPATFSIMADLYHAAERGRIGALANFAFFVGFATGGAAGVILAGFAPFSAAIAVSMTFNLVAAALVIHSVKEPVSHTVLRARGRSLGTSLRGLITREILGWALIIFSVSVGLNMLTPTVGPFSRDVLGLELHQLVPFLIPAAVLGLVSIMPAGYLVDLMGRFLPLASGLGVGLAGLIIASYTSSAWVIMVIACPVMLAFTASAPAINATMMDLSRSGARGTALGALTAVQGLGGTIGPSIGGSIYDGLGPSVPFRISAAMLALSIAFIIWYAKVSRSALRPAPTA